MIVDSAMHRVSFLARIFEDGSRNNWIFLISDTRIVGGKISEKGNRNIYSCSFNRLAYSVHIIIITKYFCAYRSLAMDRSAWI